LAFQPETGMVFEIENGATANDEINVIAAGRNYGWPDQEGFGGTAKGFADPIWTSGRVTYAATGATFVTGDQWGPWSGSLLVTAWRSDGPQRLRRPRRGRRIESAYAPRVSRSSSEWVRCSP